MKDLNKVILNIKIIFYVLLIVLIIYIYFAFLYRSDNSNLGKVENPIESTGDFINSIPDIINIPNKELEVNKDTCEIINSWWYQIIPIFSTEREWFNKYDYKSYSNQFKINGKIKKAFFCVVADVKNPLKTKYGDYYLYVLVNRGNMWWLVNVWYSTINNVYYDYKSSWNPDLNGRMYWLETPKWYYLDLNNLIVADYKNWGYKIIKPINQLNRWWIQRIGGFISAWENWIIKKFILIYTWWDIQPIN